MPLTRFGKWSVLYGVVAVEVALMASCYRVWDKLNRSLGIDATLLGGGGGGGGGLVYMHAVQWS